MTFGQSRHPSSIKAVVAQPNEMKCIICLRPNVLYHLHSPKPRVKYVLDTDVSGTFFLDNADDMRLSFFFVKIETPSISGIGGELRY